MEAIKFIRGWVVLAGIFLALISFFAAAISNSVLSDKLFAVSLEVVCAGLIPMLITLLGDFELENHA